MSEPELDVAGVAVFRSKVTVGDFDPQWVPNAARVEVYNSVEGGGNPSNGLYAYSKVGIAISARSAETYGLVASGGYKAGWFLGDVMVDGTLTKTNLQFTIDHPLDPEGKYLNHASVESDEMKNLYDGEVGLNDSGEAEVTLPAWFQALNERFRYQLTPVGRAAPNLHIARELQGNRFTIAGGDPGTRVCWQVTGVRQDAYARANPLVVETSKEGHERGKYRHPEVYGLPAERRIEPPGCAVPPTG